MKMFHESDPENWVDVHPSQIATMRNRGWTDKPSVIKTKPKLKEKKNGSA